MIATSSRTSSGRTSGSGLAIANTIACGAIEPTAAALTAPGPDTPISTSAPANTSSAMPRTPSGLVRTANAALSGSSPGRSAYRTPSMSQTTTRDTPCAKIIRVQATPAAPAPTTTTLTSAASLPTTRSALTSAARTTIAVPCWSSWKTGMSSSALSRRSISKHRGAAMSSRFMPPKVVRPPLQTQRSHPRPG